MISFIHTLSLASFDLEFWSSSDSWVSCCTRASNSWMTSLWAEEDQNKHWENQHHAIRLWGNTSGMVSQTVCYTGVCTYSGTILLVVFCLHFLQSLICFVQQFLNVLSVLLLHLKLLLLKLSHLVIQLKGVKFICVLNIVVR